MGRLTFLAQSLSKLAAGQSKSCPYCGSERTELLQRKKIVVQLRKCANCCLLFRYPKDSFEDNFNFYQEDYVEKGATDAPPPETLPHHIETHFAEVGRDVSSHIALVRTLKPAGRLLDFGCSWGYAAFQFRQSGYDAFGCEVSRPRARYGRDNLKLEIFDSSKDIESQSCDIIFTSHVLEHIPNPAEPFAEFRRLLKPDGLLVIYVPNGGGKSAQEYGTSWGPMIGEKHVLALTAEFFQHSLPEFGFSPEFSSDPFQDAPKPYALGPNLQGDELLTICRRKV
jgi:SAM-dependent methyltransferase